MTFKSLKLIKNVGEISGTKAAKLRKKKIANDESAGVRVVPIPDVLLSVLTKTCEGKAGKDILYPKTDGNFATRQTCHWWWQSFSRQCHIVAGAKLYRNAIQYDTSPFGSEVTPHFLRHTYATDLYASGVDEKARKYFLGHTTDDVTDIYTQMSEEAIIRAEILINDYHKFEHWKRP